MFKNTKAFSGFSVDNLQVAKDFYGQTLGLDVVERHGLLELHLAGGTNILVYPKDNHIPATFTALNLLEATVFQSVASSRFCVALALDAPAIFNIFHFLTIL
ncbi:hypothetical protein KSD_53160 [Ktedonobacter sp. SOSP1-85]|uniref:VOC family protein n=1 Tax=Ktedonobacter sp. SOSP1-85 TaxID=2778367 RepID=UPI0019163957|nr:hypothetical protein [Ktedonobacter sp. SOSP1-85]GHO77545.1 hypothetical protein KSD_53160 [Ktedonobacter sp. SOSP1-85]